MTDFLRSWVPSVIASVGTGALLFLSSWWLATHANGLVLGWVLGGTGVVALVTNALASGWVDRTPRRRSLSILLVVLLAAAAGYVVALAGGVSPAALVGVVLLHLAVAVAEIVYLAAIETTTVDVAPGHWPRRRLSLLGQVHGQLERIVSPVFAGGLIGLGHARSVAPAALLLLALALGATLLTSSALGLRRRTGTARPARATGPQMSTRRVWRYVTARPDLRYLLAFGAWSNLAVSPVLAMLPAWYGDLLGPGPATAVWSSRALAAYAVGMILGSVLIGARSVEPDGHRALLQATLAHLSICAGLAVAAALASTWAIVVALFCVGGLFSVLVAAGGQVWLHAAPAEARARILSLKRLVAFSTIPLGTALMGAVGNRFGYQQSTGLFAATSAALTLTSLVGWRIRASARVRA